MSAPVIWILLPLIAAVMLMLNPRQQAAAVQGGMISFLLAVIALLIPIDTAILLGTSSLKISGSILLLGRSFQFGPDDGPLLVMIYGLAALWFFGSGAAGAGQRFVPLGLAIISLLVASLAVEPFLYAALLFEIAAMLAVPLLVAPQVEMPLAVRRPHRGALRFLIYQTLAMPFILFAGWMLTGVEASPGDLALTVQSGVMLGLGFSFLLAIFPLYNWIPMIAEEASPYVLGFMLWILPLFAILLALGFLDRYAWLRTSPQMTSAIRLAALVLLVSGGWFAAFQRHLGRMLAFAAVSEVGLAIFAISLNIPLSTELVFLLFIPRGLELTVWALGMSILKRNSESLYFRSLQGLARPFPLASAALVMANLSMAGFPLMAGFPGRLALWEQSAQLSLGLTVWMIAGFLGLLIGAIRSLAVLTMAPEKTRWQWSETRIQLIMLGTGIFALFILGLFPQIMRPLMAQLPLMFEHLAQ